MHECDAHDSARKLWFSIFRRYFLKFINAHGRLPDRIEGSHIAALAYRERLAYRDR